MCFIKVMMLIFQQLGNRYSILSYEFAYFSFGNADSKVGHNKENIGEMEVSTHQTKYILGLY